MRSYAVLPDSPPEKNDLNSAPELLKLKLRLETKKKELKELDQLLETQEENENPTKRRLLSAEGKMHRKFVEIKKNLYKGVQCRSVEHFCYANVKFNIFFSLPFHKNTNVTVLSL